MPNIITCLWKAMFPEITYKSNDAEYHWHSRNRILEAYQTYIELLGVNSIKDVSVLD